MARLYADENFDYPVVEQLRQLGHDVLTAHEAGRAGQKIADVDQLTFALSQGRAVLTFNRRHFVRLHTQVLIHAGIIVCTKDDASALTARIDKAIAACPALDKRLIRVNRPSVP